jgi:hypothetical protein
MMIINFSTSDVSPDDLETKRVIRDIKWYNKCFSKHPRTVQDMEFYFAYFLGLSSVARLALFNEAPDFLSFNKRRIHLFPKKSFGLFIYTGISCLYIVASGFNSRLYHDSWLD